MNDQQYAPPADLTMMHYDALMDAVSANADDATIDIFIRAIARDEEI